MGYLGYPLYKPLNHYKNWWLISPSNHGCEWRRFAPNKPHVCPIACWLYPQSVLLVCLFHSESCGFIWLYVFYMFAHGYDPAYSSWMVHIRWLRSHSGKPLIIWVGIKANEPSRWIKMLIECWCSSRMILKLDLVFKCVVIQKRQWLKGVPTRRTHQSLSCSTSLTRLAEAKLWRPIKEFAQKNIKKALKSTRLDVDTFYCFWKTCDELFKD